MSSGQALKLLWLLAALRMAGAEAGAPALSLSLSFPSAPRDPKDGGRGDAAERPFSVPAGSPIVVRCAVTNNAEREWRLVTHPLRATVKAFRIRRRDGQFITGPQTEFRAWPNTPVVRLAPGKSFALDVDLIELFAPEFGAGTRRPTLLDPGAYSVTLQVSVRPYEWEKVWGPDCWRGELLSNTVWFRVQAPAPEARRKLWDRYEKAERPQKVRVAFLLALTAADPWDARTLGLLSNPDWWIRGVAADAAARNPPADEKVASHLERMLRADDSPPLPSIAAWALGRMGLKRSVPVLIEYARSQRGGRLGAAVRALGEAGDRRALPVLREVAEGAPDKWVREAARESISKIQARTHKDQVERPK